MPTVRTFVYVVLIGVFAAKVDAGVRTVVLSGTPAIGAPNSHFNYVEYAVMNDAGQTAFVAHTTGSNIGDGNSIGIWTEEGGTLSLVAKQGDLAPGAGGAVFSDFHEYSRRALQLNNAGTVAFFGTLSGVDVNESNDQGIWIDTRADDLVLAVRSGDNAPGIPNGRFGMLAATYAEENYIELNSAGHIAFTAHVDVGDATSDDETGIWSNRDGSLELVVRSGDASPYSDEVRYREVFNAKLSENDHIMFGGFLTGQNVNDDNDIGYWTAKLGSPIDTVYREGDLADATEGRLIRGTYNIVQDGQGNAMLIPQLTGSYSAAGIWSNRGNNGLRNIMMPFDEAPDGGFFGSLANCCLSVNDRGDISFATDYSGIWIAAADGNFLHAADHGEDAPGVEEGSFGSFEYPVLNNSGQVAFYARLYRAGSGDQVGQRPPLDITEGIWATDKLGTLRFVAGAGQYVDVDDGIGIDLRRISNLELVGIGDQGLVAFTAGFYDGTSGLFISNVAAIPEPSALSISVVGIWLLETVAVGRRRRSSNLRQRAEFN